MRKKSIGSKNSLVMNKRAIALLLICCASGAASLAYEVIYLRILTSYIVGEVYYVMASILLGVFGGLAIGAFGSFLFLPVLWILEILLGVFSATIAVICLIWGVDLAAFFPDSFGLTIILTFALGFLPFFFIGVALPCFSILLDEANVSETPFLTVYALYNFVAALSVFAAEFILSRMFGLITTLGIYAIISILIGVFLRVFNFGRTRSPTDINSHYPAANGKGIYGIILILGAVGVIWQMLFLDFVWAVFGPSQEVFSLVLFAVIFGIAASAWIGRNSSPHMLLFAVIGVFLAVFLADPFLWFWTQKLGVDIVGTDAYWLRLGLLFMVSVPIFTSFGLAVPVIHNEYDDIPYGKLLGYFSSGNALGILFYSLAIRGILEPATTSAVIIGLLLFCWIKLNWRYVGIVEHCIGVSAAISIGIAGNWIYPNDTLLQGSNRFLYSPDYYITTERINSGSIKNHNYSGYGLLSHVIEEVGTGHKTLVHSGYRVFGLIDKERLINREVSHSWLAYLFARRTDKLYLVGLGTGITAMAGSRLFNYMDIVEINPAMKKIANDAFSDYNGEVLSNHHVSLIFQDGLIDMSRRKQKYDAIVNTASSPFYFSANKIFTQDFFKIASKRLTDEGVYVGWIGVNGGIESVFSLRNTLLSVFTTCKFYNLNLGYYAYVCGNHPLRMRYKNSKFFAFGKKLFDNVEIPDESFAQTNAHDINTLDHPILSYAKNAYHDSKDLYSFLDKYLSPERTYKLKVCCENNEVSFCPYILYLNSCEQPH